jgi:hypothetical protein
MTPEQREHANSVITENWVCVDCGVNTAPGIPDREEAIRQLETKGSYPAGVGTDSEVYMVREQVWKKAGMEPFGGCLCIGCLEQRLGRRLKPKDFIPHVFNGFPGSDRLLKRRKYWYVNEYWYVDQP